MIAEADRSSARVLHLIKECSELADLEGVDLRDSGSPVQIFSLCDEVVQAAARANDGVVIAFSCSSEDRAVVVQGDQSRLKRGLTALLAATLRERGSRPLEVCGVVSRDTRAGEAVIALGDPDIATRLDDVLLGHERTFDRWRGGTGLSVPIACRIVEAHGGRIWLPAPASRADCALGLPLVR